VDPNTPLVIAGARYPSREDAVKDFHIVWGAKHDGAFEHLSVAVLSKDVTGELEVERHNSTTKKMAWSGAVLGAALVLVAPPTGVAALMAGGGAMAGAGALVGHFWKAIDRENIEQVGDLLRAGEAGLLVIAVNRKGSDITPLLANAENSVVVETVAGDLDAAFEGALAKAERQSV
jgi:uncharacterized membrane protein